MVLVALTVVGAVVVGYVRGGRLRNLSNVRLRGSWLVLVAVIAQALLAVLSGRDLALPLIASILLVISHVALLGFVLANRMLPGMLLIFVGFALNAVVITSNGAMPVSAEAIAAVTPEAEAIAPGKHRLLTPDDRFWYLADILPLPWVRSVVSVGDVILATGVGILVANLMLRRRPEVAPPTPATRTAHRGD